MHCPKCGFKLSENVKFCPECGQSLTASPNDHSQGNDANEYMKKTNIEYTKVETNRQEKREKDVEKRESFAKKIPVSDQSKKIWDKLCNYSKLMVVGIGACVILCIAAILCGKAIAGIIAVVQIVLFGVSWLLYKQIIKTEKRALYLVFCIGGFLLIVLYFFCLFRDNSDTDDLSETSEVDQEMISEIYLVKIELDCESNLFFSKYDIEVYINDDLIGTLEHGSKNSFEVELEKGSHTLKVAKEGDMSVDGTAIFDVSESVKVSYILQCSSSRIDIKKGEIEILTPIAENMARIPGSSEEYKHRAYTEIVLELEKAGFHNITAKVLEDLTKDSADNAGMVEEISINGKTQFGKSDVFDKESEIIITYHTTDPNKPESEPKESEPEEALEEESPEVSAMDQLQPYIGKTIKELTSFLEELGYTATYTAENTGDDFTEWILSGDLEIQEIFIVTNFQNIDEKAHTVEVMMLGKDTIKDREEKIAMKESLEEKLGADVAWAAVKQYGEQNYQSFKLHTITGVLAESVEDENTWFLKAYCDVKVSGEKIKNLTCEARVTGTEAKPEVIDFIVY